MLKSAIYLSIERTLKERLAAEAEAQHRSLANMLEWILIQYFGRRRPGGDGGRSGGRGERWRMERRGRRA